MKFIYLSLILAFIFSSSNGRYTGKYHNHQLQGENPDPESFKNLLQYYRSLGRSADIGSIEAKSNEDAEELSYPKYRIDLTSGREYIPMASYVSDEPPVDMIEDQNDPKVEEVKVIQVIPPEITIQKTEAETPTPDAAPFETKVADTTEAEATTEISVNTERKSTLFDDIDGIEQLAPSPDEDDEEEEDDDESEECVEGKTKKRECNTCVCVEGTYHCSKKVCTSGNSTTPAPGANEKKHEEQNQKIKNSWGKKKVPASFPLSDCSSGMTKTIDCNQCICAMGKWACTKRSCIALTLREKASYTDGNQVKHVETLTENKDLDEDCAEGNTRQLDCNQCVCHLNSWSCTKLQCAPTPPPPKPEDIREACQKGNDVKSRECNLCKCTRGLWVCTRNDCKSLGDHDAAPPAFRSSSKITKNKKH